MWMSRFLDSFCDSSSDVPIPRRRTLDVPDVPVLPSQLTPWPKSKASAAP